MEKSGINLKHVYKTVTDLLPELDEFFCNRCPSMTRL